MAQKTARAIRLHEAPADARKIDISVIVPLFDEEGNVPLLCERLFRVLDGLSSSFEVIEIRLGAS